MFDYDRVRRVLRQLRLDGWFGSLEPLLRERLSPAAHGDFGTWQAVLDALPSADAPERRRELLLRLAPWRKGPFDLGGVHVDAEWRSDRKWARVSGAIAPLDGRRVLDVGCGNGYYALRMREAGAAAVLGIDPTLLYVMQFLAITCFVDAPGIAVLPLRLHELPETPHAFDTAFSMGVLYHQRDPLDHLRQLRGMLRTGGQLVLETLFLPGTEAFARTPPDRYARMKNIWLLPTIPELVTWLERSGYRAIDVVDTSATTTREQRATEWMPFESLADALDPDDPAQTIEGWPAPRRVVVTAIAP